MSRSYRYPMIVDGYGSPSKKIFKRIAGKKVRKYKDLIDGKFYKKVSNSYDICDYRFDESDSEEIWKYKSK